MQANTGAGAGAPHKGLVEELVEKAKEYLPHQLTGVETESTASGGGYTGSTTTGYTGSPTGGYAGSTYAGSNASHTRVSSKMCWPCQQLLFVTIHCTVF